MPSQTKRPKQINGGLSLHLPPVRESSNPWTLTDCVPALLGLIGPHCKPRRAPNVSASSGILKIRERGATLDSQAWRRRENHAFQRLLTCARDATLPLNRLGLMSDKAKTAGSITFGCGGGVASFQPWPCAAKPDGFIQRFLAVRCGSQRGHDGI